jgi:predicted DNA-binding transcriptional regulator AlpA
LDTPAGRPRNKRKNKRRNRRGTCTLPEFAQRYGIARSTAYDLAKRGELPIPVIALGRRRVLSRELVERLLAGDVPSNPVHPGDASTA